MLLLRYAEIGLKGPIVRKRFESTLRDNILEMFMRDRVEAIVTQRGARFFVETEELEKALAIVRRVFGISSVSVVEVCSSRMEDMCAVAAEYSKTRISEGQSFAVRARREGSQGYTSLTMGKEIGSAIYTANEDKGISVSMKDPDVEFFVEARDNLAYIFQSYIRCHAGLPIGTEGRVLGVLDGSERGLVSAWLMMKRGCRVSAKGSEGSEYLAQYDPLFRESGPNDDSYGKILGVTLGTDLDDLPDIDVSKYSVPVFFPTIGMTDEEVHAIAETIRNGI
jgi:thiamine biosynthesis protein ThiI